MKRFREHQRRLFIILLAQALRQGFPSPKRQRGKLGLADALDSDANPFFVGAVEKELHDPNVKLELDIQAVIGEFVAETQLKKTMESKIERVL